MDAWMREYWQERANYEDELDAWRERVASDPRCGWCGAPEAHPDGWCYDGE